MISIDEDLIDFKSQSSESIDAIVVASSSSHDTKSYIVFVHLHLCVHGKFVLTSNVMTYMDEVANERWSGA